MKSIYQLKCRLLGMCIDACMCVCICCIYIYICGTVCYGRNLRLQIEISDSGGLKFSSPNSILEGMPSTFTFIYNLGISILKACIHSFTSLIPIKLMRSLWFHCHKPHWLAFKICMHDMIDLVSFQVTGSRRVSQHPNRQQHPIHTSSTFGLGPLLGR